MRGVPTVGKFRPAAIHITGLRSQSESHQTTMFWDFLNKNKALFCDGRKRIEDSTLVALTIMIAESRAEEKEMMVSVVMNCMWYYSSKIQSGVVLFATIG